MQKKVAILILILSCLAFMGLKLRLDIIPRAEVAGSSFNYIPTGKFLKYATFGYSNIIADIIYMWSIQYFSDQRIPNRFEFLDHVFSIIAELDPHYVDAYIIGAIFAFYDAEDINTCYKILDRGLEKNPDQWLFPFDAGHYAQKANDVQTAQRYFKKAMEIDGAPIFTRHLYANSFFEQNDYRAALKIWAEVYQTAETSGDKRIKKIASNHLYKNTAAIHIEAIKQALETYKEKFRAYPDKLEQLSAAGFMREIPQDLDGEDYKYDPETGEVKSTLWWKR